MPSIIQWWRDRYPEKSAGLSDEQIAIAIIQSDPHASISHPELKQYEPSAKRFDERKNGAAFDSQTAKDFSYLKDRPKEERGIFSTYLDDPRKRGVLMSKQADLISSFAGPKKEFTREDAAKLVQIRKEMEELEVSPHFKEFQEATGFVDSWGEFWGLKETPAILAEVTTESLAALLHHGWDKIGAGVAGGAGTGAAAGAIGGPLAGATAGAGALWGGAAGMGKTSYNLSASSKFLETIEATVGRDVMDDPQALFDVINDPDKMKQARAKAIKYGLPVAVFDTMSLGITGRAATVAGRISTAAGSKAKAIGARTSAKIPKTGLLDEAARISLLGTEKAAPFLAPTAFQGVLGGAGDAFGQLASEGKIDDWKSVFLEGIAEFGMAPFDLTVGHLTKDMTPEHAKALNDRINDFRKAGVTSDQQKEGVQIDLDRGDLTKGEAEVYNLHIDEVYQVKSRDEKAIPPSEEGAISRTGHKEALKTINAATDRAIRQAARDYAARASQTPDAQPVSEIVVGKVADVDKYNSLEDAEERQDMVDRDIVTIERNPSADRLKEIAKKKGIKASTTVTAAGQQRLSLKGESMELSNAIEILTGALGKKDFSVLASPEDSIFEVMSDSEETAKSVDFIVDSVREELSGSGEGLSYREIFNKVADAYDPVIDNKDTERLRALGTYLDETYKPTTDTSVDTTGGDPFAKGRKPDTATRDLFDVAAEKAAAAEREGKERGQVKIDPATGVAMDTEDTLEVEKTTEEVIEEAEAERKGPKIKVESGEPTQKEKIGFKQKLMIPKDRSALEVDRELAIREGKRPADMGVEGLELFTGTPIESSPQATEQDLSISGAIKRINNLIKQRSDLEDKIVSNINEPKTVEILKKQIAVIDAEISQINEDHDLSTKAESEHDPRHQLFNESLWEEFGGITGELAGFAAPVKTVRDKNGNMLDVSLIETWRRFATHLASNWRNTYGTEAADHAWNAFSKAVIMAKDRVQNHKDRGRSVKDAGLYRNFGGKTIILNSMRDSLEKARNQKKKLEEQFASRPHEGAKRVTGELRMENIAGPVDQERQEAEAAISSAINENEAYYQDDSQDTADELIAISPDLGRQIDEANRTPEDVARVQKSREDIASFIAQFRSMLDDRIGFKTTGAIEAHGIRGVRNRIWNEAFLPELTRSIERDNSKHPEQRRTMRERERLIKEISRLDQKIDLLSGNKLEQFVKRYKSFGTQIRAGELFSDEYLAENTELTPDTIITHNSAMAGYFEVIQREGVLPRNTNIKINVKEGDRIVQRRAKEYLAELEARRKIVSDSLFNLRVKLEKIISERSNDTRNFSFDTVRKEIARIYREVNDERARGIIRPDGTKEVFPKLTGAPKVTKTLYYIWDNKRGDWKPVTKEVYKSTEVTFIDKKTGKKKSKKLGKKKTEPVYGSGGGGEWTNYFIKEKVRVLRKDIRGAFNEASLYESISSEEEFLNRSEDAQFAKGAVSEGQPDMLFSPLPSGLGNVPVSEAFDHLYSKLTPSQRKYVDRFRPLFKLAESKDTLKVPVLLGRLESDATSAAPPGFYNQIYDQIVIDPTRLGNSEFTAMKVLIEEYFHALTAGSIISPHNRKDRARLKRMLDKARNAYKNRGDTFGGLDYYPFTSDLEFVAHAMFNDEFRNFLQTIPSTRKGDTLTSGLTLLDEIWEVLKKIVGLSKQYESLLDEVVEMGVLSAADRSRVGPRNYADFVTSGGRGVITIRQLDTANYSMNIGVVNDPRHGFVMDKSTLQGEEAVPVESGRELFQDIKDSLKNEGELFEAMFAAAALHGSPRSERFDKFSTDFMGTGEGHHMFGWGLYFATSMGVAEHYRDMRQNTGNLNTFYDGEQLDLDVLLNDGWNFDASTGRRDPKHRVFSDYLNANRYGPNHPFIKDFLKFADRERFMVSEPTSFATPAERIDYHLETLADALAWVSDPDNKTQPSPNPSTYGELAVSTIDKFLNSNHKFEAKRAASEGQGYEVMLAPDEDEYLLLDKNRAEQSDKVSQALNDIENEFGELLPVNLRDGMEIYKAVGRMTDGTKEDTSRLLLKHGIRGNKYLEGAARGKGEGNYNYVIFDDADVEITGAFAKGRESAVPTTPEEVNNDLKGRLEPPESQKGLVEKEMSWFDKFKENFISKSHPLSVLQDMVFEHNNIAGKTRVKLSEQHELQAGSPVKADLRVGKFNESINNLIGGSAQIVEKFNRFLLNLRIQDRLINESSEKDLARIRTLEGYIDQKTGAFVVPEEELAEGKTIEDVEIELISLLTKSKEVGNYKSRADVPKLVGGLEALMNEIDDPEMLRHKTDAEGNVLRGADGPLFEGKFVEGAEVYHAHFEEALKDMFESGVISSTSYSNMSASSSFYAPFFVTKYFNRNPEDTFGHMIKGIRDVDNWSILNPMDAARYKLYMTQLRVDRNVFMSKVEDFRRDFDPDGKYIKKSDTIEGIVDMEDVKFFENGEVKYLWFDREIARLLNNFDPVSTSQTYLVTKMAGDIFKLGATGINAFFQLGNFMLFDPIRMLTTSKAGLRAKDKGLSPIVLGMQYIKAIASSSWHNLTPNSIKNLVRGFAPNQIAGLDSLYGEFVNSGAAGSTIAEYFGKATQIKDPLMRHDSPRRNPLVWANSKLSLVGKTLEQTAKMVGMQRMMLFEGIDDLVSKMEATTDSGKKMALKKQLDERMDQIAVEIRNYAGSPDFIRKGKITESEALNVVFMFFNARVQGVERDLSRMLQVFKKGGDKGEAAMVMMKLSAFAALPTMLAWSMNRKYKDDYDEISDEEKKRYFMIPLEEHFEHPYIEGKMVRDYLRIPRRESFGLFSYTLEKGLDWLYERDPDAVSETLGFWLESTMPIHLAGITEGDLIKTGESIASSLNPVLKGPAELIGNRNFFRHKPIVPISMQKAAPEEQYYASTPDIYKTLGGLTSLGALKTKHLVETLTAGGVTQFIPNNNVGISTAEGGTPLGRTVASTPLMARLARSTYLAESEIMEIMDDADMVDATGRVLRRRYVDRWMNETRGMSIQDRVRHIQPARNHSEKLRNDLIIRRLREMALGLEPEEIRMKNSPVTVRAAVVMNQLQGKSPAEVKVYLTDLARKKILTQEVANDLMSRMQQRGETIHDYVTEPVR